MADDPLRLDRLIEHVRSRDPDDVLVQLANAVLVGERLAELADHVVGHFVDAARRSGASWSRIGAHLNVSKQAAMKRHNPRSDEQIRLAGFTERLTAHARSVGMVAAAREARATGHARIESDHVVLALVRDPDDLPAAAIASQGVPGDAVRTALRAGLPEPDGPAEPKRIAFAAAAVGGYRAALREALRLDDDRIETGHLLLGILTDPDSRPVRSLVSAGVDPAALADRIRIGLRDRRVH